MPRSKQIKILMMGAEISPFAKVGGLADVMGSLPPALKKLGVDVRLVMPLYGSINKRKYKLKKIYSNLEVPSGMVMIKVNVWQSKLPGNLVDVYFIDAPEYFNYDEVYVPGDNSERFLFFSFAALYALPLIQFIPEIIHCHDSHVALVPDIIKASNLQFLKGIKTLYTIHNFRYQGKTSPIVLSTGNLNKESTKSLSRDASDGDINFMVQGVMQADLVNTVSEAYAKEITTSFYGAGLDNVIKKRKADLYGILNGIDVKAFNPLKDENIFKKYSYKSLKKKTENKIHLQKKLGLPINKDIPVIGMVTRLAWQKGIELITDNFSRFRAQFVFLGTGSKEYEKHLADLQKKYSEQFSANITFSNELASLIYAGADMFLMPSRYEPCGLGQMIAMRYGTVPIVRATGGLKDTVTKDFGFSFNSFNKTEFFNCIKEALDTYYHDPARWQKLMINGMKKDFSWNKSAKEYKKLYKKLVKIRKT